MSGMSQEEQSLHQAIEASLTEHAAADDFHNPTFENYLRRDERYDLASTACCCS
jgi:hypothetical protein